MCGYINEHSDSEVISIPHLENAINFGYELFESLGNVKWDHVYSPIKNVYSPGFWGVNTGTKQPSIYSREDDSEDEIWDDMLGCYVKKSSSILGYTKKIQDMTDKEFEMFSAESENQLSLFGKDTLKKTPLTVTKSSKLNALESDEFDSKSVEQMDTFFISPDSEDYYKGHFSEFLKKSERIKGLLHLQGTGIHKMSLRQSDIDYWLKKDYCPACYSNVYVCNSMLLYTYCPNCHAVYNVPKSDAAFLKKEHDLFRKGEIDQEAFLWNIPTIEYLDFMFPDSTIPEPGDDIDTLGTIDSLDAFDESLDDKGLENNSDAEMSS